MRTENFSGTFRGVRANLKRLAWTLLIALAAGLLFYPFAASGFCAAGGECIITQRNLLWIPTTEVVSLIAAILAGAITWNVYTRRHIDGR